MSNPNPDYSFWTIVISSITLVLLAASVIAQYLGLFTGKPSIPINAKVLIYLNSAETIGGITTGKTRDSVSLKKAYIVTELYALGSRDVQNYVTGKHFGETTMPMSSILRWKKFPKSLSEQWDKLEEDQ